MAKKTLTPAIAFVSKPWGVDTDYLLLFRLLQLVEEESREKGQINRSIWLNLKGSMGSNLYWIGLLGLLLTSCLSPVAERHIIE